MNICHSVSSVVGTRGRWRVCYFSLTVKARQISISLIIGFWPGALAWPLAWAGRSPGGSGFGFVDSSFQFVVCGLVCPDQKFNFYYIRMGCAQRPSQLKLSISVCPCSMAALLNGDSCSAVLLGHSIECTRNKKSQRYFIIPASVTR